MPSLTQQQQAAFDEMSIAEKIAVLLLQLGEEVTAGIFSNMSVDAITEVSKFIAKHNTIEKSIAIAVLEEFHAIFQSGQYLTSGGMEYARELLYRTLGPDEAKKVLEKLSRVCKTLKILPTSQKSNPNSYQTSSSMSILKPSRLFWHIWMPQKRQILCSFSLMICEVK